MKLENLSPERRSVLARYVEFSVDRGIRPAPLLDLLGDQLGADGVSRHGGPSGIELAHLALPWESEYFDVATARLLPPLFEDATVPALAEALAVALGQIEAAGIRSVFAEVPSEDVLWLQALGQQRFRLIETRLHYLHRDVEAFGAERYPVRLATPDDVPNLRRVAREMRNVFDRFHSDFTYPDDRADEYLATYVENSVGGFADLVVVPDEAGVPADSFLTARVHRDLWDRLDRRISKMVLSAVSSKTNRGWYQKLVAELTHRLREEGAQAVFLNTQSTNGAVIHTWEKLGYKLGRVTHLLAARLPGEPTR